MSGTNTRAITFYSPGEPPVRLVGVLHIPAVQEIRCPAAILCHPQPLVADMDDPLIVATALALAEVGWAALRFNFRGVSPSLGDGTDGRLEALDVAGAVAWLRQEAPIDRQRMALIGHAFGAIPALVYAAADPGVGAVVAVSPPHFRLTPELITPLPQARLVVIADDDEVSPRFKVEPWFQRWPTPPQFAVVPHALHLYAGREVEAARIITTFLARWASNPSARPS